jgi:GH15 family glucan-1,4-alpha-glucosidase
VGNAAAGQLQLDVYGELVDCAHEYAARGGEITDELWADLSHVVDLAVERWQEDDASIWEVRGTDRPFTYSKAMCWVALDRGIAIAEATGRDGDLDRWREARRAVHRAVTTEGWSQELGAFVQAFGSEQLDAALLRLPRVGFLPHGDQRIRGTVDAIDARLSEGPLVRRYDVEGTGDGLAGGEGAFVMCAFWLAGALAHAGELEEAQRRFERLLSYASPLGLLAEEIHPGTGELLGNYPQAFSHLALIGAAVDIERERRGTLADRPRIHKED